MHDLIWTPSHEKPNEMRTARSAYRTHAPGVFAWFACSVPL